VSPRLTGVLLPLAVLLVLVGAWELYVDLGGVDSFVLPAPHSIAAALWNNAGLLWSNFQTTAEEVGPGILLALLAGFIAAVAMHFSVTLRRAL
jgi:ABC-type nitrate/sulfonate/bicarbonate transport system permease component